MGKPQTASGRCGKCDWPVWVEANFCSECGNAFKPVRPRDRIVAETKAFATGTLTEIEKGSRAVLQSDGGKKIAAGAAVGAVLAAAVPVIGWGTGALIGAGLVAYKRLTK